MSSKSILALATASVGSGPSGSVPLLARVVIANIYGQVLYDTYVAPSVQVADHRTQYTGITAAHLQNGRSFSDVQQTVSNLTKGNIIVGHSLWDDLHLVGLTHPALDTRDLALYKPFHNALAAHHHYPGLRSLTWSILRRKMQDQVDPAENARAAMDIYRTHAQAWEGAIAHREWPCAFPPENRASLYT